MTYARAARMDDPTTSDVFVPGSATLRQFRDALGAFSTGVTVVTTNSAIGPLGITANSFASLSLAPPLVLWSPARSSRRFEAFARAEHFAIHVLAADQIELGGHFAQQGHDFDLPEAHMNSHGVPILQGCLAVFECQHEALHSGGDHAIVVGRVLAARHRPGAPLVFSSGRYGHFSPDAD